MPNGCLTCGPEFGSVSVLDVDIDTADSEKSLTLPANVRAFEIENLGAAGLRFSWITGKVADPTATPLDNFEVAPFRKWTSGEVLLAASVTLYYASTLRGAKFRLSVTQGF